MKSLIRVPMAALLAAAAICLSTAVGVAQNDPADLTDGDSSWRVRAQVRRRPGAPLTAPQSLPDAVDTVHRAACRSAWAMLGDGEPARTRVRLTLWRQPGAAGPTHVGSPYMSCHVRPEAVSAFRLRGLALGAARWVDPPVAFDRVAEAAERMAERVLATGDRASIPLAVKPGEKPVRGMIRSLARRHGVSAGTALRVAACESGFNPRAYNPAGPYVGVFQQDTGAWPGRARRYGHPGASPFDTYANVDVSLRMARSEGWGHWGCA
jgi:soluble lytic murein transglycosylase-like protein